MRSSPTCRARLRSPNPAAIADGLRRAGHPALKLCGGPAGRVPARLAQQGDRATSTSSSASAAPAGTNLLDVLIDGGARAARSTSRPARTRAGTTTSSTRSRRCCSPSAARRASTCCSPPGYKKKLIETFKSILIQTPRNARQAAGRSARERSRDAAQPVDIYPLLPAEPFPTFYLRDRARLPLPAAPSSTATLGPDVPHRHPARASSPAAEAPRRSPTELDQRDSACSTGCAFIEADAVGMARDGGHARRRAGRDRRRRCDGSRARRGSAAWQTDADVIRDPRVIVPVFRTTHARPPPTGPSSASRR